MNILVDSVLNANPKPIDHAPQTGETEEYQDRSDFTPVVINHISGSLKPPKRRMSAYACYSRKVYDLHHLDNQLPLCQSAHGRQSPPK